VLPDVPTSSEAGYPDVQGVTFNGIFAPKQTPPAIVGKLSVVVREGLAKPDVIERLAALGSDARGSAPEEFRRFLQQETEKWTEVVKQAKIRVTQ
jgi:tripartite-type tricarboxylate transporter receptor subunit TctC